VKPEELKLTRNSSSLFYILIEIEVKQKTQNQKGGE